MILSKSKFDFLDVHASNRQQGKIAALKLLPMFHDNLDCFRQRFQTSCRKLLSKIRATESKDTGPSNCFQIDGQAEDLPSTMATRRRRVGGDVCIVYVHAGAGFHSFQNQRLHLQVCEDAVRSAMTFLKNGGDAVDAVEMAIKVLEDREITNAGFGSNLSVDGLVECDATIVDHYGRSGAVGAVGQIRNPIHLARLVLDNSTKPLTLKRVPPNLLVGPGAIEFAFQQGMPVVPNDDLVSTAAEDRWLRWKEDLKKASSEPDSDSSELNPRSDKALRGSWNESRPYSPELDATVSPRLRGMKTEDIATMSKAQIDKIYDEHIVHHSHRPKAFIGRDGQEYSNWADNQSEDNDDDGSFIDNDPLSAQSNAIHSKHSDNDLITDTVGAIAIDCLGNIAAGSSSGGIGMKHQGRVGPAALVNVGTAVIPIVPGDPKKTCVATVVSGTGEHMATTVAASTCAQRMYSSTQMAKEGGSELTDDDRAIKSFIERDFMAHPSVVHSSSSGAIGILGVKKTVHGVWLYFAHNTDTFAIASMGSDDDKPKSLMSRNKGDSRVITGGRSIKHWAKPSWTSHTPATWLSNPDKELNPPEFSEKEQPKTKKPRKKYNARDRSIPSHHSHHSHAGFQNTGACVVAAQAGTIQSSSGC